MILEYADVSPDGSMMCPNCAGTSFTTKRSFRDRALWGLWGWLMPFLTSKALTCEDCGLQVKPRPGV